MKGFIMGNAKAKEKAKKPVEVDADEELDAAPSKALDAASPEEAGGAGHDMPADELLYDLADLFRLFADTTRIKILYALMGGEKSVAALADAVGVSQSAVSHQLRNLRQAHLVKFDRAGKQAIYALSDDHVYTMLEQGMTHICE